MRYCDNYITGILNAHNTYRRKHGAADLNWDTTLATRAKDWADQICTFGTREWEHSQNNPYGENLSTVSDPDGMVGGFYKEIKYYNFDHPSFTAGHFTQVVWKATKYVGCAVSQTDLSSGKQCRFTAGGRQYSHVHVCEYDPAGNNSDYANNVERPR